MKKNWTTALNVNFIKGLDLCEQFYAEAVRPILDQYFPGLRYSAALLGPGSDVLGFDTEESMDHDWGPRFILFLHVEDNNVEHRYCLDENSLRRRRELASRTTDLTGYDALDLRETHTLGDDIDYILRHNLPHEFKGFPTSFRFPEGRGNFMCMQRKNNGEVDHRVSIQTVRSFFLQYLNYDTTEELRAVDWLIFPEQFLCGIAGGRVFHDGLGQLESARKTLRYYPHDIWLYILANQWQQLWSVAQVIAGRCAQVGDELGSRLGSSQLVHSLMRLCFIMERQYPQFAKWFGSAFSQLQCAERLLSVFTKIIEAASWQERQEHLATAYVSIACMHNDLGITDPLPTKVSQFATRPFLGIDGMQFAEAIRGKITDKETLALPRNIGSINQVVKEGAWWLLSHPTQSCKVKDLY